MCQNGTVGFFTHCQNPTVSSEVSLATTISPENCQDSCFLSFFIASDGIKLLYLIFKNALKDENGQFFYDGQLWQVNECVQKYCQHGAIQTVDHCGGDGLVANVRRCFMCDANSFDHCQQIGKTGKDKLWIELLRLLFLFNDVFSYLCPGFGLFFGGEISRGDYSKNLHWLPAASGLPS